jgi:hypothetical protein
MKKAILGSLYFVPVLAFAQNLGGLVTLVQQMQTVLNNIYPFLFGLAIIYFFWELQNTSYQQVILKLQQKDEVL